jgi:hypothetical protein
LHIVPVIYENKTGELYGTFSTLTLFQQVNENVRIKQLKEETYIVHDREI